MSHSKKGREARREGALGRLKAQLDAGTKTGKSGKQLPLTEGDIKRINREMSILKVSS